MLQGNEGPGRQQAEHEPAESHSSSKGKSAPGLHLQEHHWKYRDMIILQYSVLVRLHPESCVQVWSLQLKKDADRLEKIQRKAMKMIKGLENMPYEERLKEPCLLSLKKRMLRRTSSQFFSSYRAARKRREDLSSQGATGRRGVTTLLGFILV